MNKNIKFMVTAIALLFSWILAGEGIRAGDFRENSSKHVFAPNGGADYPCVLYDSLSFQGHGHNYPYKMWFTSAKNPGGRKVLRYAVSDDGLNWQENKSPELRKLSNGDNSRAVVLYDAGHFGEEDGPYYKVWYWTGSENEGEIDAIHYAESDDGFNWTGDQAIEQSGDYPLVAGYGTLDNWFYHLKGPGSVIYNPQGSNIGIETPFDRSDDDPMSYRYVMYYDSASEGFSPDGSVRQVSLAYSPDGISWIRYGDEPVIIPGGQAQNWDSMYIYRSVVLSSGGLYQVWYAGADGQSTEGSYDAQGIGHGTSPDGRNWVLDDDPLAHVEDGVTWRDNRTGPPAVISNVDSTLRTVSSPDYQIWVAGEDTAGDKAVGSLEAQDTGPGVQGLLPSGPGTLTEWTPYGENDNWLCVRTNDGDVSYVYSTTELLTDRYEMEDLATSPPIDRVVMHAYARKTVRPNVKIYIGIRSGGIDDLTRISLDDLYTEATVEWTADPATGLPWTVEGVNALETVINRESNHGREARVTLAYLEVYYTSIATPTPTIVPPTPTPAPTETPTPRPTGTLTPPPTSTPTAVPTATPTIRPTCTLTPPPTVPPTPPPTTTPPPTELPTPPPTSTPIPTCTGVLTTPTPYDPTPIPTPTPINIALGKTVVASGTWGAPYTADHVTDGSTTEETADYWLLSSHQTGWVRVDLGSPYPYFLDRIRWLNTHNNSFNDRAATDWRLEVSTDGVVYTEIASGTEEFSENPNWVEITDFPHDISYRYIRLNIDGYYDRGGGINEIEAWGTLDNPGFPNIAFGKLATASDSWSDDYGPDHVTDGSYLEDEIDYWLLPSYATGWVQVDLEKIYDIDKIKWLNTHNDGADDRATLDWRMDVSEDGSTFTEYSSGSEEFSSTPTWVIWDHIAVTARYIRLYVDSYYNHGGGINEIEVFGTEKNIALGQETVASGIWSEDFSADNVVDGSYDEDINIDYWLLPSYTGGWVQIKLDSPYQLSGIRWLNTHNDSYNDRAATDWRMMISPDGVDFTEVGSGDEEFSETPQWVAVTGLNDTARYVRLYVDGYYDRGGGANEIEVFAQKKEQTANIALGKPATASAIWGPDYAAANITDGSSTETAVDYWLLPSDMTGWVEVDLEDVHSLSQIRWLNTHNDGANDRAATDWRIMVSDDGIEYTQAGNGSEVFSPTPSWVVIDLTDTSVRYIRLYVDGYYNRGGGINELEAYEAE